MNLANRALSFATRTKWLGRYLPGQRIHAALHLVRVKLNPSAHAKGKYGDYSFRFMPRDMSAIKEVLEDEEYKFLVPVLADIPSPVIIDAGSHIGLFSLWVLNINPRSRILSIEASPSTYARTSENASMATQNGACWQVIHGAAWSDNGFISFCADGETMGHHVDVSVGNVQVPKITLADAMSEIETNFEAKSIDILKVDIEGAENAFLSAGEGFLPRIKNLVIELHPARCDTDNVMLILQRHYNHIERCTDRLSQKPLLHCYNR